MDRWTNQGLHFELYQSASTVECIERRLHIESQGKTFDFYISRFNLFLLLILESRSLQCSPNRVRLVTERGKEQNQDIPDDLRTGAEENGSQQRF